MLYFDPYPDNSPGGQFPHRTGFGPEEWFLFRGSGPSGELSWWGIVLGIVVLVGNGWALFLSGGELSSWGVVLYRTTLIITSKIFLYIGEKGIKNIKNGA